MIRTTIVTRKLIDRKELEERVKCAKIGDAVSRYQLSEIQEGLDRKLRSQIGALIKTYVLYKIAFSLPSNNELHNMITDAYDKFITIEGDQK